MPFVENAERPTGFWKWVNVAVTSLSTSLYDDSEGITFVQEEVMDSLTDTIPPYAGSDESLFCLQKNLGQSDTLNFELKSEGARPLWTTSVESENFGLVIDSEGGTEGSVSYTCAPW
eukprot:PhF_6_TR37244/c0_g1_i1/m.54936